MEQRRGSLRGNTTKAMYAEGYSSLAFLVVLANERRPDAVPAASLTRRRSDAQFAAFGTQAKGGSSVVHYLSDLVPTLPVPNSKCLGRVSSIRVMASGQPTHGVDVGDVEGFVPSAARACIDQLVRTILEFNRLLASHEDTARSPRLPIPSVDPLSRGPVHLERLLGLVRRGQKELSSLHCFVWPIAMRQGAIWMTLGNVKLGLRCLEPVLDVLFAVARFNEDQDKMWWSLQRRTLLDFEHTLNAHLEKLRRLLKMAKDARRHLFSVMKYIALDYSRRNDRHMKSLQELAMSKALTAQRMEHLSFAERLNKCSALMSDVVNTAEFNIALLEDAVDHPADPDTVIRAVEEGDPTSPSLDRKTSRKPMVPSYALERHGISFVNIPAVSLKRFYHHWKSRCHISASSTLPRVRAILCDVERWGLLRLSKGESLTYDAAMAGISSVHKDEDLDVSRIATHDLIRLMVARDLGAARRFVQSFETSSDVSRPNAIDASSRYRGPSFQEYLLFYPYKSVAETHLLMKTRPKYGMMLQDARLLDGVGCSLVEYWRTMEERRPFQVLFSPSPQLDSVSGDAADIIPSLATCSKISRDRADAEDRANAPRRNDAFLVWAADGAERSLSHRHHANELVGTGQMQTFASGEGVAMVVVREKEGMYLHSHIRNRFHHSSIFAGEPVHFAGEIKVSQGRIEWISNKSGHYQPGLRESLYVLKYLSRMDVSLDSFDFHLMERTHISDDVSAFLDERCTVQKFVRRVKGGGKHAYVRVSPARALLDAAMQVIHPSNQPREKMAHRAPRMKRALSDPVRHGGNATKRPHGKDLEAETALSERVARSNRRSTYNDGTRSAPSSPSAATSRRAPNSPTLRFRTSPQIDLAAKRSGVRRRESTIHRSKSSPSIRAPDSFAMNQKNVSA